MKDDGTTQPFIKLTITIYSYLQYFKLSPWTFVLIMCLGKGQTCNKAWPQPLYLKSLNSPLKAAGCPQLIPAVRLRKAPHADTASLKAQSFSFLVCLLLHFLSLSVTEVQLDACTASPSKACMLADGANFINSSSSSVVSQNDALPFIMISFQFT